MTRRGQRCARILTRRARIQPSFEIIHRVRPAPLVENRTCHGRNGAWRMPAFFLLNIVEEPGFECSRTGIIVASRITATGGAPCSIVKTLTYPRHSLQASSADLALCSGTRETSAG